MLSYPAEKQYELWVRDTGEFDGFAVYVDDFLVRDIGDQTTRRYPLAHNKKPIDIKIEFGGNDGGVTAIVDVTDQSNKSVIEKQRGLQHSYQLMATA